MGSDNKPEGKRRLSLVRLILVAVAVISGGFFVWYYRENLFDLRGPGYGDTHEPAGLLKVQIHNSLGQLSSLYYESEVQDAGVYLQDIKVDETIEILVSPGERLYATLHHGQRVVSKVLVQPSKRKYSLDPISVEALMTAQASIIEDDNERAHHHTYDHKAVTDHDQGKQFTHSFASGNKRKTLVAKGVRTESRDHPSVVTNYQKSDALPMRVRSLHRKELDMWYNDGAQGIWQGRLQFGRETATTTYEGHEFYFTERLSSGERGPEVSRLRMTKAQSFYIIKDSSLQPDLEQQRIIDETAKEVDFMENYKKETGRLYLSSCRDDSKGFKPRPKPVLHQWEAEHIGQVHQVVSPEGLWHCEGDKKDCQSESSVTLELEVISTEPRAFVIKDFLSDYEVSTIVELSKSRLTRSSVGDAENAIKDSSTRTSTNTWVARDSNQVSNSLFLRAADVLQLPENIVNSGTGGNAELMQIVHYQDGEKYDPHYDWGATRHEDRFITMLLYLTDMASEHAGGATAFPKGVGRDGNAFQVHPGRGSAVLFYNMLPDGNADVTSLHSALPVREGEKWLANFWIWDPRRRR